MTTYVVQSVVSRDMEGGEGVWRTSRSLPTFLLHSDIQGIVSAEHAEKIARDIVDPFGDLDVAVSVSVAGKWADQLSAHILVYHGPGGATCRGEILHVSDFGGSDIRYRVRDLATDQVRIVAASQVIE